jgi:hypothetical protein
VTDEEIVAAVLAAIARSSASDSTHERVAPVFEKRERNCRKFPFLFASLGEANP